MSCSNAIISKGSVMTDDKTKAEQGVRLQTNNTQSELKKNTNRWSKQHDSEPWRTRNQ